MIKILIYLTVTLVICSIASAIERKLICHYDTAAATRPAFAQFRSSNMDIALKLCTHIIYGYAGITPNTFEVTPLDAEQEREFAQVLHFKQKYPEVKFLLSIGGDRDVHQTPSKYMDLLEAGYQKQQTFLMTSLKMLKNYHFDGLDVAFQFPRIKPKKIHSNVGKIWKSFKRYFTGGHVVDSNSMQHKKQFSDLINQLRDKLKVGDYLLTLTVLPNIDSELYIDAAVITKHLDFINLATFDFYTPTRNPEEADYTAPIFAPPAKGNRIATSNVESQINWWLEHKIPSSKIIVGIATWGRAWKFTKKSTVTGMPIVSKTRGPALPGSLTKTPGLLSYLEICLMLNYRVPLKRVVDRTRKYGTYAFKNGTKGIWISYEDPESASHKAMLVRDRNLGGVAVFDIGMDDLGGVCGGGMFPILMAVKQMFEWNFQIRK